MPLHVAVKMKHLKMIQDLMQYSANINARDKFGWTPLHIALRIGNLEIV